MSCHVMSCHGISLISYNRIIYVIISRTEHLCASLVFSAASWAEVFLLPIVQPKQNKIIKIQSYDRLKKGHFKFPRWLLEFTSLVSALFNATACSAFTFFLCRTSSMSSISFGSIPSLSRNSSFSISVSFTLISNLLTWLVKSSMFLRRGNKNQNSLLIHI